MRCFLLVIFCFGLFTANAQSWRKLSKLADTQYNEGNYEEAAMGYRAAWEKKKKKKELIYKSAESYYKIKDYRKAAEAYSFIKEENNGEELMFPGLKYCRALKMDGQYDEASRAFVYFINGYKGDDKDIVANIVQDEIRGCELGMLMLEQEPGNLIMEHLGSNVNSKAADFAPVPFSDDVLYYTSNMVGETKMYLTQKSEGEWSRSRVPKNFPQISAKHFGNGAFSPDNKRFFYTQCEKVDAVGRLMESCEIFVTQRTDTGWSAPEKLNNKVNKAGTTNNHPYVVHIDGREILYFTSDRIGGEGKMDIWSASRNIESDELVFDTPKNLGSSINTMGDEITPYFDMDENALYFSSTGNVNIGGFDIMKSTMEGSSDWSKPENLGIPYNSNADDYYYRKHSAAGGYIVSNRKYGLEKTTFRDDDIFAFSMPTEKMMASGKVLDNITNEAMEDVWVAIYEVAAEGAIKLLENKSFPNGNYSFGLLPDKNYRLEANREGYLTEGIEISTINNDQMVFTNDIMIGKSMDVNRISATSTQPSQTEVPSGKMDGTFSNPQPTMEMDKNESFSNDSGMTEMITETPTNTVVAPVVERTNTTTEVMNSTVVAETYTDYPDATTTTTSVPSSTGTSSYAEEGVVYKIQLIAVNKFNSSHSRYTTPKNYGNLVTEYIPEKNITRVLLSQFYTKEEAEQILMSIKDHPDFSTALVVKYVNGSRIDPWAKY